MSRPRQIQEAFMADERPGLEYSKPAISDYGDLQELTAATNSGTHTDVPLNTPVPPFSIFS
jgi:hypothetical protein